MAELNKHIWEENEPYAQWSFLFRKKLLGSLIQRGKKEMAIKRYQSVLQLLKQRQKVAPLSVLLAVFLRASPEIHLKGGKRFIYAAPLTANQRVSLAVRWIVKPLRDQQKRRNVSVKRLVETLEDTLSNRGQVVAQKKMIYKQALAQKHQTLRYKYLN